MSELEKKVLTDEELENANGGTVERALKQRFDYEPATATLDTVLTAHFGPVKTPFKLEFTECGVSED